MPEAQPLDSPPNVVVIGAGPAGLTAAYELVTRYGIPSTVLEADSIVGGISRTVERDGWRFDIGGRTAFIYALVVVFIVFVLVRRLVNSPFGLSLRGIREGRRRMPAIGAPVARRLRVVFTLSATVAGIAGALLAQTTQFVGIDTLGFPRSADLLVMLVLGGAGRLYGGLVGAAVFMIAQDWLSGIDPVYWQFWIGFFLVVIVLFARGGILGGADALRARWRARKP